MFPTGAFADRMFAPRYWPKVGAVAIPPPVIVTVSEIAHATALITGMHRRASPRVTAASATPGFINITKFPREGA